ncbi:MAG: hypothetical protein QM530_10055 [Phycisphaerales bacterium]|nr:hypothetical protein [Phycisphaerales bacterium]
MCDFFTLNGTAKLNNNTTDGSGGGVFSKANAGALITDFATIENNTALNAGGGLFGPGTISKHASISNNKAESGGGIASFSDGIFLRDSVKINNNTVTNSGAGIWLNNCGLNAKGSFTINNNKIITTVGALNFGSAIYDVNGIIDIRGGEITGNLSKISTIYASTSNPITLVSCHIYNPLSDGKRIYEYLSSGDNILSQKVQ